MTTSSCDMPCTKLEQIRIGKMPPCSLSGRLKSLRDLKNIGTDYINISSIITFSIMPPCPLSGCLKSLPKYIPDNSRKLPILRTVNVSG